MKKKLSLILAVVLVISLTGMLSGCSQLSSFVSQITGLMQQPKIAVQVGDHEVTDVELNYYYIDAINDYCQQYGPYLPYLFNIEQPLNEQVYDEETGMTWDQYFLDTALYNIHSTYALYYYGSRPELNSNAIEELNNSINSINTMAALYGYSNADAYLCSVYGEGASLDTYRAYLEKCLVAQQCYDEQFLSIEVPYDAIYDYDQAYPYELNSYNYAYCYIPVSHCYPNYAGTYTDDGIIYTDGETADATELAYAIAGLIALNNDGSVDTLNANIEYYYYLINTYYDIPLPEEQNRATAIHDQPYHEIADAYKDWIVRSEHNNGETTVIPYEVEGVIQGYYVVLFNSCNDNRMNLVNVRHVLIQYEGDKEKARREIEDIFNQFISGSVTEDAFAELAREYSQDGGSRQNGGLYEDIYPGQMIPAFDDWCFDSYRYPGDFDILETEYGYHLMYFVSYSDINYRELLIEEAIRNEKMDRWFHDLLGNTNVVLISDENVDRAHTIGSINNGNINGSITIKPGENGDIEIVYPGGNGSNNGTIIVSPGGNASNNGNNATAETAKANVSWIFILVLILLIPVILIVGGIILVLCLIGLLLGLVALFLPLIVIAGAIILIVLLVKRKKKRSKA